MQMNRKQAALAVLTAWIVILLVFIALSAVINIEIFFVLWLIGLLVIVELTDSTYIQPRYMRYIKGIVTCGVIVFGIIVALKVLEIIAK